MTSLISAPDSRTHSSDPEAAEIWFLTGSQSMYGEGTLRQVEITVEECRRATGRRRYGPRRGRVETGADRFGDDPARLPRRQPRRSLHRRHRVDAHVLAGEDVDPGPRRAAQAVAPPPHPGQRVVAVVDDRHGLHEPQPGRPRRPRVRPRPDPPRHRPQDRRRPRRRSHGSTAHRHLDACVRGRLGPPATADGAVRRQHAQRCRHRRRQGRSRAPFRCLGQQLCRQRPRRGRRSDRRRRRRRVDRDLPRHVRRRGRASSRRRTGGRAA